MGACSESGKASDWKSLAWLLFTPQGREFCEDNLFPTIEMWRDIKPHVTDDMHIFIDRGTYLKSRNSANIALVGETEAKLEYSGADMVHKVIIMHGAKARIRATNYAVVLVVIIGEGCVVEFDNDETAKILR